MEVVAGGVGIASFAIQLTDQIIKFKRFWDCVKEAPEDVAFIIEDIETLAMVLTGIGDQSKADPLLAIDKASADRCILSCQAAMKQLSTAVNHLDKSISKHKWLGATKAALKKDVLAKLMARVERAKAKLTLSNQIYIIALQRQGLRQSLDMQRHYLEVRRQLSESQQLGRTSIGSSSAPNVTDLGLMSANYAAQDVVRPDSSVQRVSSRPRSSGGPLRPWSSSWFDYFLGSIYYQRRGLPGSTGAATGGAYGREKEDEVYAALRAPAWLLNRAWEVRYSKAISGWTINFRTCNIISKDSLIFRYAKRGNADGVRDLIREGNASPFDCDEYGWTALHVAALWGNPAMCVLSLDEGADMTCPTTYTTTAFHFAVQMSNDRVEDLDAELVKIFRKSEKDTLRDISEEILMQGHIVSQEALVWMQQEIYPPYFDRPLAERVESALHLSCISRGSFDPVDTFRRHICHGPLDPYAFHVRTESGMTILHWLADLLAYSYRENSPYFRALLKEAVEAGASLSPIRQGRFGNRFTPLMLWIGRVIFWKGYEHPNEMVNDPSHWFRTWVQEFCQAGADLLEYGRLEKQLFDEGLLTQEYRICQPSHWESLPTRCPRWRLISFTYGPTPEEWHFWCSNPRDEMAGEFWNMVETLETSMPGAWLDDDDSDDDWNQPCGVCLKDECRGGVLL